MRNKKGQFSKGHIGRTLFRTGHSPWNKGLKGTGFGCHPENIYKWNDAGDNLKSPFTCENCRVKFFDYPSNRVQNLHHFCSRKCRGQFMSKNLVGENSLHWQDGIIKGNRHRARKQGKEGYYTFAEWEELKRFYNYMCLCCKRNEPEIKLSEDHIIPISRGGGNTIENIQPLCIGCNKKKFTQTIDYRSNFMREAVFQNPKL